MKIDSSGSMTIHCVPCIFPLPSILCTRPLATKCLWFCCQCDPENSYFNKWWKHIKYHPRDWCMEGFLIKHNWKTRNEQLGLSSGTNRCSKGAKQVKYGTEKWVFRTTFDLSLGTVGEQTKPIYIGERPAQIHRPISAWLKSRAAYINWIDMT